MTRFTIFLSTLLWSVASLAESCPTDVVEGSCIVGQAYRREAVESADDCCALCVADSDCKSWNLMGEAGALMCALKNMSGARKFHSVCTASGTYKPTPGPSPKPPPTPPEPKVKPLLDTMFQGGSVLQRDMHVAIWGTSTDKKVTVRLLPPGADDLAVNQVVPVNASGIWLTYVPPQPAGYGYELTVSDATGKTSVSVSVGEVILCAGQSNMGMQVGPSVRAFDADNATAEAAAAGRYTGKIYLHARTSRFANATMWYDVTPISITTFSAVCWYAGRDLWFHMGERVPVGLIMNAVGAHPIEHWLGPNQIKACVADRPLCRASAPNSKGWASSIVPMQPFTIGTMLWDQGEQNLKCNETDVYPCLTKQLVESYREQFNSSFPFISVQLPAYYSFSGQFVFPMRLAQDEGSLTVKQASIVPTYDDSCAMGKTTGCPHTNVHNVHKQPVGARLALQMRRMTLGEDIISEGPRVSRITVTHVSSGLQTKLNTYKLKMEFMGTSALHMAPTRNCSICCGTSDIGEFDASSDGSHWYNGTKAVLDALSANVEVSMPSSPQIVRYTANRLYPQCAVYGKEGVPAMPFQAKVSESIFYL